MIAATPVISDAPPVIAVPSRTRALVYRALVFPLKFVWGMLFCQSFLGSILVVGWTYRLAQRAALKFWWSRRAYSERGITLDQFLSASERTKPHQHWPNWFLQQNFRETIRSPERRAPALRDSPAEDVSEKSAPSPPLEERAGEAIPPKSSRFGPPNREAAVCSLSSSLPRRSSAEAGGRE